MSNMDGLWIIAILKVFGIGILFLIGLWIVALIIDSTLDVIQHVKFSKKEADDEIERLEDELDNEREVSANLRRLIKDLKEGKTNV